MPEHPLIFSQSNVTKEHKDDKEKSYRDYALTSTDTIPLSAFNELLHYPEIRDFDDIDKQITYLIKYCNYSLPQAQFCIGLRFHNGFTVAKDAKLAATLYQMAANQGNARAQLFLGYCFDTGFGVDKNRGKLLSYIRNLQVMEMQRHSFILAFATL